MKINAEPMMMPVAEMVIHSIVLVVSFTRSHHSCMNMSLLPHHVTCDL